MSHAPLAVDGGIPVRTRPWPTWPEYDQREEDALRRVLHSGQWWSVGGTEVEQFEREFAAFQQAAHGICCTNGTAALEIALRALNIGCGDEVIVPPYTFIATASSVLAVGATPVFVDIDPESFNIDPAQIDQAVTPRTRAVIPVHIAGGPADLDGVLAAAAKHGLSVIEDAAQAHAAAWNGRRVGAIGDCGTFSFQASKNLNAGEGGILITNNEDLADRLWSVTNVGRTRTGKWYEHHVLGGNFRLTEWQGAILRTQLGRLEAQTARRTASANRLTQLLAEIPGIRTLKVDPRVTTHAYHLYMFRYQPQAFGGRPREEFLKALNAEGVPASGGYVPLHLETVFRRKQCGEGTWCRSGRSIDYAACSLPVTQSVCADAVWLGQNLLLAPPEEMQHIADAVSRIQQSWG